MENKSAKHCPICKKDNQCGNIAGHPTCWCSKARFPEAIFELVPPDQRGKACICKDCLDRFVQIRLSGGW
ncbi:cysteine-rich CWC family protein [Paenibacillus tarimensis]